MIYRDVPITELREPDWSWHYESEAVAHKLDQSLALHGQLRAIVVRQVGEGALEIVEGRSLFRAAQRLGKDTVTVVDLGPVSRTDAILAAMSLELRQEIDYVQLGREVAELVAAQGMGFSSVVPFNGADIGYYVTLSADFDWSQFHEEDRQEGLFGEELAEVQAAEAAASLIEDSAGPSTPVGLEEPTPTGNPVPPVPRPTTRPSAPVPHNPPGPSALAFGRPAVSAPAVVISAPAAVSAVLDVVIDADAEVLLTAQLVAADLQQRGHQLLMRDGKFFITHASLLTPEDRVQIATFREELILLAKPWVPEPPTSLATFLGDGYTAPVIDWTPDEPPDLTGIDEIILNFATNGLDWAHGARPVGVTVSTPDGQLTRFLPFAFKYGGNLDEEVVKRWAKEQLRGKKITNARIKFDLHQAREWGVDLEAQGCTFSDIQHTAALLDDHRKQFRLDALCEDYFPGEPFVARVDESRHDEHHASEVAEREIFTAQLVARLLAKMYPELDAQGLRQVQALEDEVIPAIVEMEKNGSPLDMQALEEYSKECNRRHESLLMEVAQECGFGFDHTAKAWQRLFESLGLPATDGNDEAIILAIDHPLVRKAHLAAQYASLDSKTFKAYRQNVGSDGILRVDINQLKGEKGGTVSGRLSVGYVHQVPNQDNHFAVFGNELFPRRLFIPDRTPLDGFIPEYLEADAMQIEQRLLVHHMDNADIIKQYDGDYERLMRGEETVSFHKVTWAMMKQYKADMLYSHQKSFNFARQYGARSIKLAVMMGFITEREGEEIRAAKRWNDPRLNLIKEIEKAYRLMVPQGDALLDRASHLAKTKCDKYCRDNDLHREFKNHPTKGHRGYVKTLVGRRSRYPANYKTYTGLNRVLQGTGADIMKKKLAELHRAKKHTGLLMRLSVHDAVGGDAQMPETKMRVSEVLNAQSYPLKVPILWSVSTGQNWAECK